MFNYSNIPETLKQFNQFLNFKFKTKENGKTGKPPVDGKGYNVSPTESGNWMTYEEAIANYRDCEQVHGISFVLDQGDGLVGIDLDNCVDNGSIEDWANDWIQTLDSYTEISPSGTGLRIFIKGEVASSKKEGNIEVYGHNKPLTLTGNHLESTPIEINVNQEGLDKMMEQFNTETQYQTRSLQPIITNNLDDDFIIGKAKTNSTTGAEFTRLFGQGIDDGEDHSEADLKLCKMLAFWAGKDEETIDRIFRKSALYREKWERDSYRNSTIKKAIEITTKCYTPENGNGYLKSKTNGKGVVESNELDSQSYRWEYTEIGIAEKVIAKHGDEIKWCETWKKWLCFNGKYWDKDNEEKHARNAIENTLKTLIAETAKKLKDIPEEEDGEEGSKESSEGKDLEELGDKLEKLEDKKAAKEGKENKLKEKIKTYVSYLSNTKFNSVCNLMKTKCSVAPDVFDTNKYLFNLKNGTMNLKTGKLKKHDKEDYITKISDISYKPKAKAEEWESFLKQVIRDQQTINYLQKAIGYTLTGSTEEECLHFLYGNGRNGKTTFIQIIEKLLGDYAKKSQVSILMKKDKSMGQGASNDIARLKGARFVSTTELGQWDRLDEGLVKDLTSTDTISGRFLYSEFFDYEPTHKLWLYGNHKPSITGQDEGIWRRIRLVNFPVQIAEEDKDTKLEGKLEAELEGILSWAIKGCLNWQQEGLYPVAGIKKATEEYREEMRDSVSLFDEDICVKDKGECITTSDLNEAYLSYCEKENHKPMTQKAVGIRLKEMGLTNGKEKGVRVWFGIRLADFKDKLDARLDAYEEREEKTRPTEEHSNSKGSNNGNGHVGHVSVNNSEKNQTPDTFLDNPSNPSNPSNPPFPSTSSSIENKKDSHKKKSIQRFFSCDDPLSETLIESGDYVYVGNGVYALDLITEFIESLETLYPDCRIMPEDQQDFVLSDWEDHCNRLEIMHENHRKNSNEINI